MELVDMLECPPAAQAALAAAEARAALHKTTVQRARVLLEELAEVHRRSHAVLHELGRLAIRREAVPDPLENDDSASRSLLHFSQALLALADNHAVAATHIRDAVVAPLTAAADTTLLDVARDRFWALDRAHTEGQDKYARVSRKKETEKSRFEANAELYQLRRERHAAALHYANELNLIEVKQRFVLQWPLIELTRGMTTLHTAAAQQLSTSNTPNLSALEARVFAERAELARRTTAQAAEVQHEIERAEPKYHPDIDETDPFLDVTLEPIDESRDTFASWLRLREPRLGKAQYRRVFVSLHDNSLHLVQHSRPCTQPVSEAPQLLCTLTGARVQPVDRDDRRYVFEVSPKQGQRAVVLQAEGERQLNEWLTAINNASRALRGALRNKTASVVYFEPGSKGVLGVPAFAGSFRDSDNDDNDDDDDDDDDGFDHVDRGDAGEDYDHGVIVITMEAVQNVVFPPTNGAMLPSPMPTTDDTDIAVAPVTWSKSYAPPPPPPPPAQRLPPPPVPARRRNPFADFKESGDVTTSRPHAGARPDTIEQAQQERPIPAKRRLAPPPPPPPPSAEAADRETK